MNRSTIGKIAYVFETKQKIRALILLFIIFLGAFVELAGVGAVLPFINAVLNPEDMLNNQLLKVVFERGGFRDLNSFIVFLGFMIIAIYILKNIYVYLMHSFQYSFTYDNQRILSLRMMKCYMAQPYPFHVEHNSAELIRNINEDVVSFFEAILAGLQLLSEGGVCIALIVFLLIQDPAITFGVVGLGAVFALIFVKVFRKKIRRAGKRSRDEQAATRQTLLEALGSIKEIKVLQRERAFTNRYDGQYRDYAESNRKFKVYSMIPKPVMETVAISGLMLVVCIKILMGQDPASFIPTISLFAVAAFRMLPSVNRVAEYLSRIMFSKPAIDAIYHDLKEIEALKINEETALLDDKKPLSFNEGISVKNITFRYPGTERFIFQNADLFIKKNTSVAFIGASGGGKTTLADIILGLLTPMEGEIFCDDTAVSKDMRGWRSLLGYIPQSISLLDASIRDNILFGNEDLNPNNKDADSKDHNKYADSKDNNEDAEIKLLKAIEQAQLKTFIDSLPQGLDTIIGEGGVRLSGGQRQRIGIARALYNDPQILLLDEATSALDNDTEAAVMDAIDSLAGQKTLIIIAHRLSTIENCDEIYRIEGGKIEKEKG